MITATCVPATQTARVLRHEKWLLDATVHHNPTALWYDADPDTDFLHPLNRDDLFSRRLHPLAHGNAWHRCFGRAGA